MVDIQWSIAKLSEDSAYDQVKVYDELKARQIRPIILPRSNAVIWTEEKGIDLVYPRNEDLK